MTWGAAALVVVLLLAAVLVARQRRRARATGSMKPGKAVIAGNLFASRRR